MTSLQDGICLAYDALHAFDNTLKNRKMTHTEVFQFMRKK